MLFLLIGFNKSAGHQCCQKIAVDSGLLTPLTTSHLSKCAVYFKDTHIHQLLQSGWRKQCFRKKNWFCPMAIIQYRFLKEMLPMLTAASVSLLMGMVLHMSWNHHGNKLHYSKSVAPGSLKWPVSYRRQHCRNQCYLPWILCFAQWRSIFYTGMEVPVKAI